MPPSNGSIPVHSEVGYFRWFSIIRHTVSISIFQNASKCTTSTFSAEINNRKSCRRMRFSSSKYTKMLLRMVNLRTGSHRQAGPDLRAVLVAPGSTLSRRIIMPSHFHLYGELRFPGVTGRRNGPSGLREDDDDDTGSLQTTTLRQTS